MTYNIEQLLDNLYSDNLEETIKATPELNSLLDTLTDEFIETYTVKPKVQKTLDTLANEINRYGLPSILLTHDEIAELVGASKRTIIRHLQELEEKGCLYVNRCIVHGIQLPNEYRLSPFPTGKPNGGFTLDECRDDEYWSFFLKSVPLSDSQLD